MTYQKRTTPPDKDDHGEIASVSYQPPVTSVPIETFTFTSLRQRRPEAELTRHQRIDFELLVWCRGGSGRHEVDFEPVELVPGRIVHVRPGQVHRWILEPEYEAQLVLLRALETRRSWEPGPQFIALNDQKAVDLDAVLGLVADIDRDAPLTTRSLHAVRELLVSMLGLDQAATPATSQRDLVFADFERLVGHPDSTPRTVAEAARTIGCSTRTLTRACHESAGASPKVLLDQAWALEAQRRLSMGDSSATGVAESLGFNELSHFTRFYTRVTGETPSAFAARFVT